MHLSLAASSSFAVLISAVVAQTDASEPRPLVVAQRVFAKQADFDRPLWVAFEPSMPGTAFVVTQPGKVFAVPCDEAATACREFADLTARIYSGDNWEEGLLGFCFDPQFAQNGHVFVCFTEKVPLQQYEMRPGRKVKTSRHSVVARYSTVVVEGERVLDPKSELRVLTVVQPFPNHNGGTIVFGPDGMLYCAFGDGGLQRDPFKNGQDKGSVLGKVLRIDVRAASAEKPYVVPADNPFVADATARGEIWCYGLRNPWRIAFDRATGDLWCGDVGQDEREEVDRLEKGGNYGWSLMEGTSVFSPNDEKPADLVPPIAEYEHKDGVSVTGGHVYRGKAIPELVGCYVYGDFATSRLWSVKEDRQNGKHVVREIGRAPSQLSSFAEEPDGELLMTCFDKKVYRLVPPPAAR